jgi:chaperonin cofactor prefoldin
MISAYTLLRRQVMATESGWRNALEGLREIRDELQVQGALGRAELRDRFQELEKRWHELEGKLKVLGDQARDDFGEVEEAAKLLVDEIGKGYDHIRSRT